MYATYQELTDEGVTCDEPRGNRALELASSYIDLMTGQWFELRTKTFKFDGKKQDILFLPVFAKTITEIKVDGVVIDPEDYTVYNGFYPDDRKNPKIVFTSKLSKGNQNVAVTGEFGYVDEDGTIPDHIKKICLRLALNDVETLSDESRTDNIDRGRIISETTDGHRYTLQEVAASGIYTGDPEIDTILVKYKRPILIGAV